MQYLLRQQAGKPGKKRVAHLWDGEDTVCRLWSTGGIISKDNYKVEDDPGDRRLCGMCVHNESQPSRHGRQSKDRPVHLPTVKEIEDTMTPAGGWTRDTLASWGVPWPPPKGWRQELIKRSREANMVWTPSGYPLEQYFLTKIQFRELLRELGFPSYSAFLWSPGWLEARRLILKRSYGRCEDCGGKANDVHHLFYSEDNVRLDSLVGLIALCRDCHGRRHAIMPAEPAPVKKSEPRCANDGCPYPPPEGKPYCRQCWFQRMR